MPVLFAGVDMGEGVGIFSTRNGPSFKLSHKLHLLSTITRMRYVKGMVKSGTLNKFVVEYDFSSVFFGSKKGHGKVGRTFCTRTGDSAGGVSTGAGIGTTGVYSSLIHTYKLTLPDPVNNQ